MKIELGLYDPVLVKPMRNEVTSLGFTELLTEQDVQEKINAKGYTLVFINSVCGCAAGKARPGLKIAVEWARNYGCLPENLFTAFAGMEKTAVNKVRELFKGFPPSSPQLALLKDGELLELLQRNEIENSDSYVVSDKIKIMINKHCITKK